MLLTARLHLLTVWKPCSAGLNPLVLLLLAAAAAAADLLLAAC
jgi:hypothetical protein